MNQVHLRIEYRRLTTPKSASIAGILFGVLFTASLVLLRLSIPAGISTDTMWISTGAGKMKLAVGLMPFAGVAYLWFIGVLRDRLGDYEDRFFSTVFFGSSLLFLAMAFVSVAIVGGIIAMYPFLSVDAPDYSVVYFGRALMIQISNVYALRMAGVTMMSLSTIWIRTGLTPRWLAITTYALALVLLLVINLNLWITLIFPIWVMFISLFILLSQYKKSDG